jgi:hypothetical protein
MIMMHLFRKTIALFGAATLFCSLPSSILADTPQAIGFEGALPDFNNVEVESNNVYDYTFTSAPTDWRVQSGVWEMTNRWSCSPGWSWFGGRSEEVASIWNKRKFSGDVSIQFYFAFKMGMDGKNAAWAERPSDAAITFCGDGQNLGSGYSLIIGADNNTRSVLLKQGKVVAESNQAEAILPSFVDGRVHTNLIHRAWWYAKINKIGNRVECWLDNQLLFSYEDSQPLDAGQIALWTYNNGLMLSRVQVFYENEIKPSYKSRSLIENGTAPKPAPAQIASR